MKMLLRSLLGLLVVGMSALSATAADRPNVLFIAIDDLNDWVGCLHGHPQIKTPHIDALARQGTLFTNAHCQAPLCNPSRCSLLTGLRPSTTGIYSLSPSHRDVKSLNEHVTLPQTFTSAGYHTYTCGKIYHGVKAADRAAEFNTWGPAPGMPRPKMKFVKTPQPHPLVDWGIFPEQDTDQADWKIASAAVEALGKAPKDKPFFVACGFRLPHVPCYASQKWFDLYPAADLKLPPLKENDRSDTPRFSWYLHWKLPEPRLKFLRESKELAPHVRAYLASISFVDSQVGRVLEALQATGRADNTIIVLWSDHGYHLGEKEISGKNTLWERSTHVPLVFAGPGISKGARCQQPVELLDMFPTLLDLAGFPGRKELEGHSLVPQLKDANAERPWPAITTHNQGNHTVRSLHWRYIRYADGSEELYDLRADPNEWTNLAADAKYVKQKEELARWLPKVNQPPVPGSGARLLTYDPQTKALSWEGQPIQPKDPIPEVED